MLIGDTPKEISSNAQRAAGLGFQTLKIKVGNKNPDLDLEKLKAIRETVGQEIAIRIDANGGWEPNKAIEILSKLDDVNPEFIEEPTKGIENLAFVRQHVNQKIAIDESLLEIEDFGLIMSEQIADVVVIKPSAIGGISLALHLIEQIKNSDLEIVVTSLLDGAFGVAAAAHLTSACELFNPAPGLGTSPLLSDDLAKPLNIQKGHLVLNKSSGLGVNP